MKTLPLKLLVNEVVALIGELREFRPDLRVLCVSGLGAEPGTADSERLKPHGSLTKPYPAGKLLTKVRETLRVG
jgi:hypothetical protein